jgi:Bacterial membrane protein YfhO
MPNPSSGHGGLWALGGAALVLALLLPALRPDQTLVYRDALPYAAAQNRLLSQATRHVRLLEWDTSQYAGVPYAASPPGQAVYPPRLVAAALLSPHAANEALTLLHLLLALAGAYHLARALRVERPGARVAAMVYVLAGPILSLQENLPSLAGAAWLPWAVAWAVALRRRPSARRAGRTGLGLALPVLGGDPQAAVWAAAIGALVLLGPWPTADARPRPRVGWLALAALVALALSAAVALPALAFVGETTRGDLGLAEVTAWSLHPARLVELIYPLPFGLPFPDKGDYAGSALAGGPRELWTRTISCGGAALLLAACGLRAQRPGRRLGRHLGLGLVAVGLLLALGHHTPLYRLLAASPYGVFRYPEKHTVLAALGLALLAGLGAEHLVAAAPWRDPRRAVRATGPWAAGWTLAVLAGAWPLGVWAQGLAREAGQPGVGPGALLEQAAAVLLVQGACLGALVVPGLTRRRRSLALVLLVAATGLAGARPLVFAGTADLATITPPAVSRIRPMSAAGVRTPAPSRVLRFPQGPFGAPSPGLTHGEAAAALSLHTLQGASCGLYGLEGLHGMTGYWPRRVHRLLQTPGGAARGAVGVIVGPAPGSPHAVPDLDALSVRALLPDGLAVYEHAGRPRLELLTGVTWVTDEGWTELEEGDLQRVVATGGGYDQVMGVMQPGQEPGPAGRILDVRRPIPERTLVEVQATSQALLVVRDAWSPGWSARVNGVETEVRRVDGALIGVGVPPGPSRVELTYVTPGLRLGLLISLLGMAAVSLLHTRRGAQPNALVD